MEVTDWKQVPERTIVALCAAYAATAQQRAILDERLQTYAAKGNADDASSAAIWDDMDALVGQQTELIALLARRNASTFPELRAKAQILAQIASEMPEFASETSGLLSLSLARDVIRLINDEDARG